MKHAKDFTLEYLHGIPYLLPYGQAIADLRRGLKLNETGAFLWHALQNASDFDAFLDTAMQHYHADAAERVQLAADLRQFLDLLTAYGILLPEKEKENGCPENVLLSPVQASDNAAPQTGAMLSCVPADAPCRSLVIAGLRICFYGEDADFPAEFDSFLETPADAPAQAHGNAPDLTILVRHTPLPKPVADQPLLTSADLTAYGAPDGYTFLFPSFQTIEGAHLTADGRFAAFYCGDAALLTEELFHAIRFVFLYTAQPRGLFAMHSVSILYRDRLWLFSGHSGMGKSTHAALWERLYQTPVINGDLNLLAQADSGIVAHGIPWCGTSGVFDTATYPVGGIFLLKRGQTDYVCDLSADEQQLLTMQRLISPAWTKTQFLSNLAFADNVRARVPVMRLVCTKNESAAIACKAWIDAHSLNCVTAFEV